MAWTKNFTLPTNFNNNNQFDTSSVLTPDMFNVPYQNTLYLKDYLDIVEGKLSNIDKSLYNLGAYDTITANADGSYTITRQTGYLVLDGVKNKFDGKFNNTNNEEYYYNGCINYISKPSNTGTIADIISNTLKTVSADNLYSQNIYGITVDTAGLIIIGLTTSISTIEDANAWLIQNPTSIQYKLATATTEKVEKNHYARYNERFILEHNKSEAERSANLLNIADKEATTTNGITYSIKDGVLKFTGTATQSFNLINVSLDLALGTYYVNTFFDYSKLTDNFNCEIVCEDTTFYINKDNNRDGKLIITNHKIKVFKVYLVSGRKHNATIKPMLVRGSTAPTTYQPYNQNKHITNNEAEFLKNEYDRSANLFSGGVSLMDKGLVVGKQYTITTKNKTKYNFKIATEPSATAGSGELLINKDNTSEMIFTWNTNKNWNLYVYDTNWVLQNNDDIAIMLNEGDTALPYQEYEGKIVHLKDLELYGTKPAIANVQCPIDLSMWNDDTGYYSSGSSVMYLHFENDSLGNIYLLPTSSSGSMTKAIVRYTGGDTDAFTWSIGFITNNYIQLRCATKFYLYAPASSNGTLKTANYVLEIEDMYGHTFSLPFSVNYKV